MIKIIISLFFIAFSTKAETIKVHVPGMVCQMCVQGMQKQFKSAVNDAETDVQVDLDEKIVTLKTKVPITDDDIKKRVQNAGYNAKRIIRIDKLPTIKAKEVKSLKSEKVKIKKNKQ